MQQLEASNPQFAGQINDLRNRLGSLEPSAFAATRIAMSARAAANFFNGATAHQNPNPTTEGNGGLPQFAAAPQPLNASPAPSSQPTQWQWPTASRGVSTRLSGPAQFAVATVRLQASSLTVRALHISAVSIHSVTGPSFTSDTNMCSRNLPVATSMPATRTRATKSSYNCSANSGGAASVKLGRRPRGSRRRA